MPEQVNTSNTPRVVSIEDNPGDIRLIEEGITAVDSEIELRSCNNGRRAIDLLTSDGGLLAESIDLVLLYLNLPGRSGFEILKRLREASAFDTIPIVVLSSSTNRDDRRRVYEWSANAYITKPTDPDEFIQTIGAVVRFWIPSTESQ